MSTPIISCHSSGRMVVFFFLNFCCWNLRPGESLVSSLPDFNIRLFVVPMFSEMTDEDVKYAIPACTHFHLFRLTLFWFFFYLSFFFSTKVGVHVTGIMLRGRSLKMVKSPRQRHPSQAEPLSLWESSSLPSFLPSFLF